MCLSNISNIYGGMGRENSIFQNVEVQFTQNHFYMLEHT